MIAIKEVLSPQQLQHINQIIAKQEWVDGSITGGQQSNSVKNNQQLSAGSEVVRGLEDIVGISPTPCFYLSSFTS